MKRFLLVVLERPKKPVDEKDLSAASPQGAALGNCDWGQFSSDWVAGVAGQPYDDLRGSTGLTDLWSMLCAAQDPEQLHVASYNR